MNTWFTSDTHFGHANIIKYTNRPFSSVEEMNNILIQNWNQAVRPNDTVYHLGDFAFGRKNIINIAPVLNGNVTLILGNHDGRNREDYKALQNAFNNRIENYLKVPGLADIKSIILFHYPIYEWDGIHKGNGHLFGHVHTKPGTIRRGRSFDIGVDANGFQPLSLEEVVERFKNLPILTHHENERE